MRKSFHRTSRIAATGLAVTLLALTTLTLAGVLDIRRAVRQVAEYSVLAAAYNRASEAVTAEESLERKYRLEPAPDVRAGHLAAGAQLRQALADVGRDGDASDRALAARVLALHAQYVEAIRRQFDSADAGNTALVLRIDHAETDPVFNKISQHVRRAASEHEERAAAAVAQLNRVEALVYAATVAGFAVGLCLLAAFGVLVVGYQRDLIRQSRLNQHQALHDALTGLPNRALLTDRLDRALHAAQRTGDSLALMLFDLDRFKEVNDTLGHFHGDELLRQVAQRVGGVLRDSDTVARLGGDEFAVLLPSVDPDAVNDFACRVLSVMQNSFDLGEFRVDVEASLGVVIAPIHGESIEDLMRHADVAMYAAKEGRTGIGIYDPTAHTRSPLRLVLLGDLRRALEQPDELRLHYQPKIDLRDGQLCGVEALLRWYHPVRGLLSPGEFIPIVEETSLINRLTARVLRTAIVQIRRWLDQGLAVPVAVNLSPRCLLDPKLAGSIRELIQQNGVPAYLLRLEVTEGAIMADTALAVATLTELHELGVHLSIDDYGTGYSSMGYLRQLPVDELKIDRSFVMDMTSDPNNAMLVRGAIELGHSLGLSVVAEGVELADHVTALRALGCDVAQGYHYARAMPPEQLADWLRHRGGYPLGIVSGADQRLASGV